MSVNKKPFVLSIEDIGRGFDFDGPDDIYESVDSGANVNGWIFTPLVNDLKILLSEHRKPFVFIFLYFCKMTRIQQQSRTGLKIHLLF